MPINGGFINTKPSYYRVYERIESYHLADVYRPNDTFDSFSPSGFEEILVRKPWESDFCDRYQYLRSRPITDVQVAADKLIEELKNGLRSVWNPHKKHMLWLSAGKDSRLLLYVLKDMEKNEGFDIGELTTVTWYEDNKTHLIVDKVLGEVGIDAFERHRVLHPSPFSMDDVFPFIPSKHPNAFAWHGLQSGFESKGFEVVSGSFGGEMLEYPGSRGIWRDRYAQLWSYLPAWGFTFSYDHANYDNPIYPYLYIPFMDTVFSLHESLFHFDMIRDTMLKRYHPIAPFVHGHRFNFTMSMERVQRISYLWRHSPFFEVYGPKNDAVASAMPALHYYEKDHIDAKLFGLAMTLLEVSL